MSGAIFEIHSLWSESSPDHYIGAVGQVNLNHSMVTSELPLLDGLSEGENADGKDIRAAFEHLSRFLILFDW